MFSSDKIKNGLIMDQLKGTLAAIKESPKLARFKFKAQNNWISGGHSVSSIKDFYGVCREDNSRGESFTLEADQPQTLLGKNRAPNPAEIVLHALGSCLNSAMVYNAASQDIDINHIESQLEGEIDLQGIFDLNPEVRSGYKGITVKFSVKSDATEEQLKALAQLSPVFDMLTNPTPIHIEINKQ